MHILDLDGVLQETKSIMDYLCGKVSEAQQKKDASDEASDLNTELGNYDEESEHSAAQEKIKEDISSVVKDVLMHLNRLWEHDLRSVADDSKLPKEPSKVYMLCQGSLGDAYGGPAEQAPPCLFYGFYSTREMAQAQANTFDYQVTPVGVLLDAPARRKPVTVDAVKFTGKPSFKHSDILVAMMGIKGAGK